MTDVYAIEIFGRTAGLAVRALSGFIFYSSDPLFDRIDGRTYRRRSAIHASVKEIFEGTRNRHPGHPAVAAFFGWHENLSPYQDTRVQSFAGAPAGE
jgi:hypothetical protein